MSQIINRGKTSSIFNGTLTGSGTHVVNFTLDADEVLLAVLIRATSGDIDITADTYQLDTNVTQTVITFDTISTPSVDLAIQRSSDALANMRLIINHTDDCDLQVAAKGVGVTVPNNIVVPNAARASQLTVGTSAQLISIAPLQGVKGAVLKNNNTEGILYLGYSLAEATVGNGFPLGPGESLSIVADNTPTLYGIGTQPIDLRAIELAR